MPGKQDWATPRELFEACERRFLDGATFDIDLAANEKNHMCKDWIGPGSRDPDLLDAANFGRDIFAKTAWLNPPFADTGKFLGIATKFNELHLVALVLASTSTAWFREYVCGKADVYFLTPRPRFEDGLTDAERGKKAGGGDRDLMILDYNRSDRRRRPCVWNWKTDEITEI